MNNKLILLVEDNPNDVVLTQPALKRANIANALVVVKDGVEALEYLLGKGREDCDPDKMPVVVLTSSSEEKDMVESYKLGANSYVRKPVRFDEFAESVRQLDLYWLVLNEPPPIIGRS